MNISSSRGNLITTILITVTLIIAVLALAMSAYAVGLPAGAGLTGAAGAGARETPRGNVSISCEGRTAMFFQVVTGLGSENEVVERRRADGQGRETVNLLPGNLKFSPLVFKRVLTSDQEAWLWRQQVIDGRNKEMNCEVNFFETNSTVGTVTSYAKWTVLNAWPSAYTVNVVTEGTTTTFEILTVVYEGLRRDR